MLEKKSKANGLCRKLSEPITAEEARAILHDDLSWMAEDRRELLRELYVKMRCEQLMPGTIVDYIREAFTCAAGNVCCDVGPRYPYWLVLDGFPGR